MSMKSIAFNMSVFQNGMTGSTYFQLITDLAEENKTTGPNQSKDMVHYTQMNVKRMHRWLKTMKLTDEFVNIVEARKTPLNILVITEGWCGDAAHNTPFIQAMEKLNDQLSIRYILRDENTDVIDAYLTKGGRSIPKLIAFTNEGEELFSWGPRPEPAQQLYEEGKAQGKPYSELAADLQVWYNKDKGNTFMKELGYLLSLVQEKSPVV